MRGDHDKSLSATSFLLVLQIPVFGQLARHCVCLWLRPKATGHVDSQKRCTRYAWFLHGLHVGNEVLNSIYNDGTAVYPALRGFAEFRHEHTRVPRIA